MRLLFLVLSVFLFSCSNTIYIVRHAEKTAATDMITMKQTSDPPLSIDGEARALALRQKLESKNVTHIYSTNTIRTISTAKPLKNLYPGLLIQMYSSKPDSMNAFIQNVKTIKKGNVLIVGHSNTIDDLANKLAGTKVVPGDLKDSDYDNLYILKRKGDKYEFTNGKYGKPSQ